MNTDQRLEKLESEMSDVRTRLAVAETNIKDIKEDISSIKDDTKWIRRAFTNAIIVSVVTGVFAIIIAVIKGAI